jgi:hypothetical protein
MFQSRSHSPVPMITQFLVIQREIDLRLYERLLFPSVVDRNTSDSKVETEMTLEENPRPALMLMNGSSVWPCIARAFESGSHYRRCGRHWGRLLLHITNIPFISPIEPGCCTTDRRRPAFRQPLFDNLGFAFVGSRSITGPDLIRLQ